MSEVFLDVRQGDSTEVMRGFATGSAQTCITSPPYYGLRDYGMAEQIGLEDTPEQYVARLVAVFREVWRVLADDGTLWLNLGDSYANDTFGQGGAGLQENQKGTAHTLTEAERYRGIPQGLKRKDLIGIPWRVAFALQADGWYLRQDIIWQKPNPMPESVTDRCTKAHEYVFLLTKQPHYFYDAEAVKEPTATAGRPQLARAIELARQHGLTEQHMDAIRAVGMTDTGKSLTTQSGAGQNAPEVIALAAEAKAALGGYYREFTNTGARSKADSFKRDDSKRAAVIPGQTVGTHRPDREESTYDLNTRNRRSVWSIAPRPFKDAHFAVMPVELAERCLLAGSRPGDTVLDPFAGAYTTPYAALMHGRSAIGAELNPEYMQIGLRRVRPLLGQPRLLISGSPAGAAAS